jgi:hypothetical protein
MATARKSHTIAGCLIPASPMRAHGYGVQLKNTYQPLWRHQLIATPSGILQHWKFGKSA